jgi:hypothetical protein
VQLVGFADQFRRRSNLLALRIAHLDMQFAAHALSTREWRGTKEKSGEKTQKGRVFSSRRDLGVFHQHMKSRFKKIEASIPASVFRVPSPRMVKSS